MTEYIYIVKCPGCEDEMFNFFTDARMQCDLMMSKHPIITQIEVERNDFGECTDSHDLGTVWSWEEAMKDTEGGYTEAEPAASVFTKDDLKNLPVDNDPEFDDDDFYFMNNSIAEDYSRRVSFKSKAEQDEFMKLCSEIGLITGEDLDRFMVDNNADDSNLLDKLRAYRDELGDDFELKEASLFGMPSSVAAKSRAPIDSDFIIAIKNLNNDDYSFLSKSYKITHDINNAMTYSSKFGAEDELKYAKDAVLKGSPAALDDDPTSERFSILTFGEAKNLPRYERKPIPEGMTIEELVEEMEENEDTVECTWCNDLFDKSECRKEVDLGWLCGRCEAAIKSRGETLTFRENNYWDFLDEDIDTKETVELEYPELTITLAGNQRDVDDWDEVEHTDSYTYAVDKDDVATTMYENFLTDEDIADVPGGFDTLDNSDEEFNKFMEAHFDSLFEKYYDKLLSYYKDSAEEDFRDNYSYDDYKADRYSESCATSEQESHLDILEEDAEYSKRLTACPECGEGSYDHETGFCIHCGFN